MKRVPPGLAMVLLVSILALSLLPPAGSVYGAPVAQSCTPAPTPSPTLTPSPTPTPSPRRTEASNLVTRGQEALQRRDTDAALAAFNQALEIYREIGDRFGEANTLLGIALAYDFSGQYARAADAYQQTLELQRALGQCFGVRLTLVSLGSAYQRLSDYPRAASYFEEALALARVQGDPAGIASTLNHLGQTRSATGRYTEAAQIFEEALDNAVAANEVDSAYSALNNLATVYTQIGRYAEALEKLELARTISRALEDRAGEAVILNNMAQVYERQGQYAQARELLEETLRVKRELGDRAGEAIALNNLGTLAEETGEYARAQDFFGQATAIFQATADRSGVATTLDNLGVVYLDLGRYQDALDNHEQALATRRELGDRNGEQTSLNNIGLVYHTLGQDQRALQLYEQALAIARELGNRAGEGIVLGNMGSVLHQQAQFQPALERFEQALGIARAIGNRPGESTALNNQAGVYVDLGLYPAALEAYQASLAISREVGDRSGESRTLNNIGQLYDTQQLRQEALDLYDQALAIARDLGDRSNEATVLNNIGATYRALGNTDEALARAQEVLSIQQDLGERASEGIALNNLGTANEDKGDYDAARGLYENALTVAREVGIRELEGAALGNLVALDEKLGNLEPANQRCDELISVYEDIMSAVTIEELKTSLSDLTAAAYEHCARIRMHLGQPEAAFNLTERARARTLLEQLARGQVDIRQGADAELVAAEQSLRLELISLQRSLQEERGKRAAQQNREVIDSLSSQVAVKQREYTDVVTRLKLANPEYASLVSVDPLTLPDVQALLDDRTTLLSYFVTKDATNDVTKESTLVFVITRDSFTAVELPIGDTTLRGPLEQRTFARDRGALDSLQDLYTVLVAPVRDQLRTPRVGVIPHGVLHYLPFAALRDGEQYFGEQVTLFTLPSASTLPFVQQKRKGEVGANLLAMAQGQPTGALAPLPNVDQEARTIADLYGTTPLLGGQATEAAFKADAGSFRILHLASHGEYNPNNPLFSRLVLGPGGSDDGSLEVHEVYGLDLAQADLVVLSACETSLGARSRGDDVVGLNRAFIYAGTPSVVASLWSVNDQATGELMRAFYGHLEEGMGKAEALQAAQAEIRARYPHPFYWAPFVLTGDPG